MDAEAFEDNDGLVYILSDGDGDIMNKKEIYPLEQGRYLDIELDVIMDATYEINGVKTTEKVPVAVPGSLVPNSISIRALVWEQEHHFSDTTLGKDNFAKLMVGFLDD